MAEHVACQGLPDDSKAGPSISDAYRRQRVSTSANDADQRATGIRAARSSHSDTHGSRTSRAAHSVAHRCCSNDVPLLSFLSLSPVRGTSA